jgi:hypothetical protein
MTEKQARAVADTVLVAAAVGAAVVVVRTPKLRRLAWQLARQYVRGPLALWAVASLRDAWDASATRPAPAGGGAGRPRYALD